MAFFTPQHAPFRPSNRSIRLLSHEVVGEWYGNIVVAQLNKDGYIKDVEERDVGLVEHLVLR